MNTISVVIVAKDNPPFLLQSLKSVNTIAGETIVIDIGLLPIIKKRIAELPGVKVISMKPVPYVEKIREKTKKFTRFEYILFLDPDEVINEKLGTLLVSYIGKTNFIKIPRKNIIFQKWIQHSRWWPDYQIRFFKKSAVTWPTLIHKQPQTTGDGITLEAIEANAIEHFNYVSIDEYMMKALRYAKSEAHELTQSKQPYMLKTAVTKSLSEFISRYFAEDGYKDGMHGFVLAILQLFYSYLVYFYYWEEKKYNQIPQQEIVDSAYTFFKNGLYETHYWHNKKQITSGIKKIKGRITNLFLK